MIRYPNDYNPILEYWKQIKSGQETVCHKIYLTYRKLAADVSRTDWEYFYSPRRGNHVIEFAENFCRHSKGKFGGQRVVLELWERAMLAAIFGFIDINGNRKYREAALIVAKKNGKSLIASIVGLYMMIGDGEAGPEVYAVATKKDQAKIIWNESRRMVRKSPSLGKRIKTLTHEMTSEDFNDGIFKPLASDSDTLDGLNVHCVLMDEVHQWKHGISLYNIMADGTTARDQPLVFMTTTAGFVRGDIYDTKYEEAERVIKGYEDGSYVDERFIAFVYELDSRKEWTDPKCWRKANPGLGTIKNLESLQAKVEKAKANPALVKNLVCKEFNIPETSQEAWLNWEQINNTETYNLKQLKPRYGIGGADLSSTTDLTAAKVLFRVPANETIYTMSMYWIPEELVEQRAREDKIPYDLWIEQGYMRTCPGNKIHAKYVTEWFVEVQREHDIYLPWIGYDSWSAMYWVEEMQGYFGKNSMIPVIQGKKTLSDPMKRLGNDLSSKLINYNNNPIDKWCLANTAKDEDKNGNIQPIKTSKSTRRIDGTAALLNAYVIYCDKEDEYLSMI